jgi:hypothetical protein
MASLGFLVAFIIPAALWPFIIPAALWPFIIPAALWPFGSLRPQSNEYQEFLLGVNTAGA